MDETPTDRFREAESVAVRLLGSREHGTAELTRKLLHKGHEPDVVDAVVERLVDLELVSDERFADGFVRARIARGQGPVRIRAELRERGIDDPLAEELLTETDGYWRERAEQARRKRFGAETPAAREAWNRQARFLSQRGFPSDVIYRVLGESG